MTTYTTTQLALICGKSERTVQRWIFENKLRAQHIEGNSYSIEESDLQPFLQPLPREAAANMGERIKAVESQISQIFDELQKLERQIQEMREQTTKPTIVKPARPAYEVHETPAPADMPAGSVLSRAFSQMHGVNNKTFRDHLLKDHVPCIMRPKPGRDNETERWLTPEQQAVAIAFWQSNGTSYTPCAECPHQT